jgi:hypothetical protein
MVLNNGDNDAEAVDLEIFRGTFMCMVLKFEPGVESTSLTFAVLDFINVFSAAYD